MPRRVRLSSVRRFASVALLAFAALAVGVDRPVVAAEPAKANWEAGFARVVITPEEPMWLSGYGARTMPSEGKLHDLYCRAMALRDSTGHVTVFVALDLIGVSRGMVDRVLTEVRRTHPISRADAMFACSHTHCGPALDDELSYMLNMTADDWQQVRKYQAILDRKVVEAILAAWKDLRPARLDAGTGRAGFAVNRRDPIAAGPTDHDVPVLRVSTPDGKTVRGLVFSYACHNTTLAFQQWCGDYAGFAAIALEERHPGAIALFHTGCGADQNPLPRRTVELCEKYGRTLAAAVNETLAGDLVELTTPVRTAYREVDLPFESIPTKEELAAALEGKDRYLKVRAERLQLQIARSGAIRPAYPYPVQVWRFGDKLVWVALGGEVVVDYSLRLKKELAPTRAWITGYANDVMAYVPSERVLREGGYEGDRSMIYYQQPSKWKTGLEQAIVDAVHALAKPPQ